MYNLGTLKWPLFSNDVIKFWLCYQFQLKFKYTLAKFFTTSFKSGLMNIRVKEMKWHGHKLGQ